MSRLKASAESLTPSIPYSAIQSAGAYGLHSLTGSDETYNLLRQVYMNAVHSTYILPLVVTGLAFLTTFAIEHRNIRKVDKERQMEMENMVKEKPAAEV